MYKSRSEVVREVIRMKVKADLEKILEEKGLDQKIRRRKRRGNGGVA
ncbi:MAG: hypothetical protein ACLFVX_07720 [Archaeoglobaceae archaeon]